MLGHREGVVAAGWPVFDSSVARAEEVVIPIQVNGKLRARLTVTLEASSDEAALRDLALKQPQVEAHLAGKKVARVVVVPRKLVNVVAR